MNYFFNQQSANFTFVRWITFVLTLFLSLNADSCYASHGMGGEITWTCSGSGNFRFQMKFYRDCNGVQGPNSITLSTTVPGVPSIPLTLVTQMDISPNGLNSAGTTACPDCAVGNISNPIPGLVEEFYYQSAPVTLPGIPPASGWVFSWGECCRSLSLLNIMGAGGSVGFQNRAIMYPYQGLNTSPCYDSSPYFVEAPATISCTGIPASLSAAANDRENDSLVYSWGQPLNEVGAIVNFAPGYTINSQLPSVFQHPLNVAATIDPHSGAINFTSYTGGYFATIVKVTAYKCGIKVAEIFREINIVLNNNCPSVLNGVQNFPPEFTAPFIDAVTMLQTSYSDTVMAGDTVSFTMNVSDFDLFNNNMNQDIRVSASGNQFGAGYSDPDSGCAQPPCATLSPVVPFSVQLAGQFDFNWVTDCEHVAGAGACGASMKTHYFVFKASDNYCPANGSKTVTVAITVVQTVAGISATGLTSLCSGDTIVLTASGALTYNWNTGQTTDSIVVTQPGTYTVYGTFPAGACVYPDSATIVVTPELIPTSILTTPDTFCVNSPPVVLSATPPGGTWFGGGVSQGVFYPATLSPATYMLIYSVTDSSWCIGSDSIIMFVDACTGIEETPSGDVVMLYPNPAGEEITMLIHSKQEFIIAELYNIYGQLVRTVYEGTPVGGKTEVVVNTSDLAKGVYIIRLNGRGTAGTVFVKN